MANKESEHTSLSPLLVRCCLVGFAAALGVTLSVATGLIPKYGQWYSINSAYRRQTEAMLHGSFALSHDPRSLGYDMAWVNGGVQQVWGLGVPTWRLPYEALAKLFGYNAFPDRLALIAAIALLTYGLVGLLVLPAHNRGFWDNIKRQPEALAGVLLLVLFPPFLALCRTNFDVYEEAEAYAYLMGIGLFALMLQLIRRPTLSRLLLLATVSGLAPFVRPTLFCYGLFSIAVAFALTWRRGWPLAKSSAGPAVFCLGLALLFLTNAQRFGSGFEFGHTLNVNVFLPMMYATRFTNPIYSAPISERAAELFSYLFLVREHIVCCDGYAARLIPWQASVVRWRDVYFSTYDMTFLALLLPTWIASFSLCWQRKIFSEQVNEAAIIAVWALLSSIPLALLFLNYPVMSSRYMMDFAPAFAVTIWAGFQLSCWLMRTLAPTRIHLVSLPIVLLAMWWTYQVSTTKIFPHTGGGTIAQPKIPKEYHGTPLPADLSSYTWPMDSNYDIPFNGYGWDQGNGRTASVVVLYLRGAGRVELELSSVEGKHLTQSDWDQIRVKIGLEELRQESSQVTPEGRKLTFTRSSKIADQSQIEIAFIALTNAKNSAQASDFKLQRVRWQDDVSR